MADGCSTMVNHESREPRDGKVFVIRKGNDLIVTRTLHDKDAGWLLVSDNPDKGAWPTHRWLQHQTQVVGKVR